ncbi:MAG: glycosyltransferase family 39 protein [Pseudomonadota bacterium]
MSVLDRVSAGWKAWVLLALIPLVAAAPGVFTMPALDRDESRFAQASKQMLESRDFIEIRYQDEGRNKKPAGIHWLQAASTAAFSSAEANQIWSYRLPSLAGAVLATLALFWTGLALFSRPVAFAGAALFGAGLLLTSEAHISKTDAVLVALVIWGMGALARLYAGREDVRPLAIAFWLAMSFAFLIKGPVGPMAPALAIAGIALWERRWDWARPLLWWAGPALFVVLVLPWFAWVQLATGGDYLEGAVGKDLRDKLVTASEGHGGPPGYHLAHLATHFFPATLLLIPSAALVIDALRGKTLDGLAGPEASGLRFLMVWAVPTWLVFELLPTKLSHYILPAYPALALLCGWGLVQLIEGVRARWAERASLVLFALGAAALCLIGSSWGVALFQAEAAGDFQRAGASEAVLETWDTPVPLITLVPGLALAGAAIAAGASARWATAGVAAVLASVALGWHLRAVVLPGQVWMQPTTTARLALAEACGLPEGGPSCAGSAPARVQAVGYAEPSLVFTTGTETTIPPNTAIAVPDDPSAYPLSYLLNVEDEAGAAALTALVEAALRDGRCMTKAGPLYALNYSNGDPVAFVALRLDAAPCAGEARP